MLSLALARLLIRFHPALKGFDPDFYLEQHPDLYGFSNAPLGLIRHYLAFGQKEGRFSSEEAVLEALRQKLDTFNETFDPRVYELLNEDLGRALSRPHEFVRHFLDHGRLEGRPWQIGVDHAELPGRYWQALFRTADFLSYADDWLDARPTSREAAIRLFIDQGVERLAPLNLKHVFDPAFYRAAYDLPAAALQSDTAAYRHWLSEGLGQRACANDVALLAPYLKGSAAPAEFDWQAYRKTLPVKAHDGLRTPAQALSHVFEAGLQPGQLIGLLTGPAPTLIRGMAEFSARRGRHQLALDYLDLAERQGWAWADRDFSSLRLRLLHRLGRTDAATTALAGRVLEMPGVDFATYESTVEQRLAREEIDDAFAALAQCRASWRKLARYRALLHRALNQAFDVALQRALARYRLGDRPAGDALMRAELERCLGRLERLDDMPPRLGPLENGPVVTLANQELFQCKHYRVSQRLELFEEAGIPARVFDEGDVEAFLSALPGARAAVFYRTPPTPSVARAMLRARKLGIPVFFEVDDILFDGQYFPDTLESYEGQISPEAYEGLLVGVPLFRFALDFCDHAIASTPALAQAMRNLKHSGEVHLIRNGLDSHTDTALERARLSPARQDQTIRVFYGSGTKSHNSDFNLLAGPALLRALKKHPHLELVIAGHLKLNAAFKPFNARIRRLEFTRDIQAYWSQLARCDINLAVLRPGFLADTKSEIKWLEAAVLGVPSIVSPTQTYREILTHRETALFAENAAEWEEALEALITSRDLRQKIGQAARAQALRDYGVESRATLMGDIFAKAPLPASFAKAEAPQLKLLVCHVFFAPQTYGGATRVVEDNVRWIKGHCPDIEVSIFASDEGVKPKGRMRIDDFEGSSVYRVSVDAGREADMRLFDDEIARHFRLVIERTKPEIIHFHCIQRLSATIVREALAARIPYLITLHDGWWISDHQFLIDEDGFLRLPEPSSPERHVAGPPKRHEEVNEILRGAHALLGVSNSFSRLHEQLGLTNVIPVANGTPALAAAKGVPSSSGTTRIAHIGDRSVHKGAVLVEAVLRRSRFARLELTMIDNSLPEGEVILTHWGETAVRLQGPVRQQDAGQLYANMDVLLAPSVWPESFGLVVREALDAGVHVIVSDRGALKDEVIPGETGTIISVETSLPLQAALARLDETGVPPQGRQSDAPRRHRTSDDQARELVALYRRATNHRGESI